MFDEESWEAFIGAPADYPEGCVEAVPLEEMRRIAERLSRRQKLEPAEQYTWDTWYERAQELVLQQFREATCDTYDECLEHLQRLNLENGYHELREVLPRLDDIHSQDEFQRSLLVNDGLRVVCYDKARTARRWLVFVTEMMKVWEGIWEGLSIATSQEQRKSQFLRATKKMWRQLARLKSFLQLYDDTQRHIREVYERMKTLLSSETSWPRT